MPKLLDNDIPSLEGQLLCRDLQVRQLTALVNNSISAAIIVHGSRATGKTLTVRAVLDAIDTPSILIPSRECITTRHLLERIVWLVKEKVKSDDHDKVDLTLDGRCESISAFFVELQHLLGRRGKFIVVFDGIDRQRDAAPTLLPAIGRLGELVPLPLCTSR